MNSLSKALVFGGLLALSTSSYSQTNFVVGTENLEYLPFTTTQQGLVSGYFKELLDKFAASKGYSFTIKPLPVQRLLHNLLTDKVDFKIPDHPLWGGQAKQGKSITYSDATTRYVDGVLVMPANQGKGKAGLKSIATVKGFTPFIFLDDINSGTLKLREALHLKSIISMTQAGRADGAFANVTVAERYMNDVLKQPGALVYDTSIPAAESDISLSTIKHAKVIDEFNQFLKDNADWVNQLKKTHGVP